MPWSTASAGVASSTSWPWMRQLAGVVRGEAGQGPAELLAARADHPGDAQDLAGMQLEADVAVGAAQAQPFGLEHHLGSRTGRCSGSR